MTLAALALILLIGPDPSAYDAAACAIYKELIEINTTDPLGDNTQAAEAMAARLRAAGFPESDVQVLAPMPRKGNLVARLRGTGQRRPLLLLAHLDVVEARREDWSVDPFVLLEKDGFFYGRGTGDDKAMAAIWVATLIRLRQEGYRPDRDLIVALTADEESGPANGVDWLLRTHRELMDAELALNEGGGGEIKDGRYRANRIQAAEKVYQSFRLEVTDRGGHSSLPRKDNAIYRLAAGLGRLAAFEFPLQLGEVTRGYFARMAALQGGQEGEDFGALLRTPPDAQAAARLSAVPFYNAQVRTTCVPTRLEGGHAENALPQMARAVVNCRILPGTPAADVQSTLVSVLADDAIVVTPVAPAKPSPPSPLTPDIMEPVERTTSEMWPGLPVLPVMSTGATDSLYLRQAGIRAYGVSGLFGDIDDNRAHGRDERLGVRQFYEGREFLYRLVKRLSSAAP
ncbi:MAG: peptidase M20 [Acidobacteria bacterium]|nr:MAG: peptidase M20 [Acidobacteriota bacterium]